MNRFKQEVKLTNYWHLRNIFEIYQICLRHRDHLIVSLYNYRTEKKYREEGFSSFKEGFYFFKAVTDFKMLELSSLWKYFGVIDAYVQNGYNVDEIIVYPISQLIALKPYLKSLLPGELEEILNADKTFFNRRLNELKKVNGR